MSTCAHELNLSSLYVGDDSTWKLWRQQSAPRKLIMSYEANASGSTVSAAVDVNDHEHLDDSLTLLRTHDDLIALAGLPLDHDLVIDNFKLCAIIRGIVAASEAGSMFDETEVSMRICGRSPRAVRSCYRIIAL